MPRLEIETQDGLKHQVDFDTMPTDDDIDEVAQHLSSVKPSIGQNFNKFKQPNTFDAVGGSLYEPSDIGYQSPQLPPPVQQPIQRPIQPPVQQPVQQQQQQLTQRQQQLDAYNKMIVQQRQRAAEADVSNQLNDLRNNSMLNQVVDNMASSNGVFNDRTFSNYAQDMTSAGDVPNVDGALQAYISASQESNPSLLDRAKNFVGRNVNAIRNIPRHIGDTIGTTLGGFAKGFTSLTAEPIKAADIALTYRKPTKDDYKSNLINNDEIVRGAFFSFWEKNPNLTSDEAKKKFWDLYKNDSYYKSLPTYKEWEKKYHDDYARSRYAYYDEYANDVLNGLTRGHYKPASRSDFFGGLAGMISGFGGATKAAAGAIKSLPDVIQKVSGATNTVKNTKAGQAIGSAVAPIGNVASKIGQTPIPLASKVPIINEPTVGGLAKVLHQNGTTVANFSMYDRALQDIAGVTPDKSIPEQYVEGYVNGLPFSIAHLPMKAGAAGLSKYAEAKEARKALEKRNDPHGVIKAIFGKDAVKNMKYIGEGSPEPPQSAETMDYRDVVKDIIRDINKPSEYVDNRNSGYTSEYHNNNETLSSRDVFLPDENQYEPSDLEHYRNNLPIDEKIDILKRKIERNTAYLSEENRYEPYDFELDARLRSELAQLVEYKAQQNELSYINDEINKTNSWLRGEESSQFPDEIIEAQGYLSELNDRKRAILNNDNTRNNYLFYSYDNSPQNEQPGMSKRKAQITKEQAEANAKRNGKVDTSLPKQVIGDKRQSKIDFRKIQKAIENTQDTFNDGRTDIDQEYKPVKSESGYDATSDYMHSQAYKGGENVVEGKFGNDYRAEVERTQKERTQKTRKQAEANKINNGEVDAKLPPQEPGKKSASPNKTVTNNNDKVTVLEPGAAEGADSYSRKTSGDEDIYKDVKRDSLDYTLDSDIDYNDEFWQNVNNKYSVDKNGNLVYKYGQKNAGKPVKEKELLQLQKDIKNYFKSKRNPISIEEQIDSDIRENMNSIDSDVKDYVESEDVDDNFMHYTDKDNNAEYNENAAKYSDNLSVYDADSASDVTRRYTTDDANFQKFWEDNFVNVSDSKKIESNVKQHLRKLYESKDTEYGGVSDVVDFAENYLKQLDRERDLGRARKPGETNSVTPELESRYEQALIDGLEELGLSDNQMYNILSEANRGESAEKYREKTRQNTRNFIVKNVFNGKNGFGTIGSQKITYTKNSFINMFGKKTNKKVENVDLTEDYLIDEISKQVPVNGNEGAVQRFYDDYLKALDSNVWFKDKATGKDVSIGPNMKSYANELVQKAIDKAQADFGEREALKKKNYENKGYTYNEPVKQTVEYRHIPTYKEHVKEGVSMLERFSNGEYTESDVRKILSKKYDINSIDISDGVEVKLNNGDKVNFTPYELAGMTVKEYGLKYQYLNKNQRPILKEHYMNSSSIKNDELHGVLHLDKKFEPDVEKAIDDYMSKNSETLKAYQSASPKQQEVMRRAIAKEIAQTAQKTLDKFRNVIYNDVAYSDYSRERMEWKEGRHIGDTHVDGGMVGKGETWGGEPVDYLKTQAQTRIDNYQKAINKFTKYSDSGNKKPVIHQFEIDEKVDEYFDSLGDKAILEYATKGVETQGTLGEGNVKKVITNRALALENAKINYKKQNEASIRKQLEREYSEGYSKERRDKINAHADEADLEMDKMYSNPTEYSNKTNARDIVNGLVSDEGVGETHIGKTTTASHLVKELKDRGLYNADEHAYLEAAGDTPIEITGKHESRAGYYSSSKNKITMHSGCQMENIIHEARHAEQYKVAENNYSVKKSIVTDSVSDLQKIYNGKTTVNVNGKDVNLEGIFKARKLLEKGDKKGYNEQVKDLAKNFGISVDDVKLLSNTHVKDAMMKYATSFKEVDTWMAQKGHYDGYVSVQDAHKAYKQIKAEINKNIKEGKYATVSKAREAIRRTLRKRLQSMGRRNTGSEGKRSSSNRVSRKSNQVSPRGKRETLGSSGRRGVEEDEVDLGEGRKSLSANKAALQTKSETKRIEKIHAAEMSRHNYVNAANTDVQIKVADFNKEIKKEFKGVIQDSTAKKLIPFIREGKFPKSAPEYLEAYNKLTPEQQTKLKDIANKLNDGLTSYWKDYSDAFGVKSSIDNSTYVPHVYKGATEADQKLLNQYYEQSSNNASDSLKINSKHAVHRVNDNLADVIDNGLKVKLEVGRYKNGKPKYKLTKIKVNPELDYSKLITNHANDLATILANKRFVDFGQTKMNNVTLSEMKEFVEAFDRMTEKPLDANLYDKANAVAKSLEFTGTFFHHRALTESAFAISYKGAFKSLKGDYTLSKNAAKAKDAASSGVDFAPLSDAQTREVEDMLDKAINVTDGIGGDIASAVPRILKTLKGVNEKVLWDYLQNSFKLMAYDVHCEAWKKANKTDTIPLEVKQEIAQMSNDFFGGQIFENLHVSKKGQRWLQRLLKSPDWNISATMREFFGNFSTEWGQKKLNNWAEKSEFGRNVRGALRQIGVASINNSVAGAGARGKYIRQYSIRYILNQKVLLPLIVGGFYRIRDFIQNPEYYDDISDLNPYKSNKFSDGNESKLEKALDFLLPDTFMGRSEDGNELYARTGKQGREFLEIAENGKYSALNKAAAKGSFGTSALLQEASTLVANKFGDDHIKHKYGWQNNAEYKDKEGRKHNLPFAPRVALNTAKQFVPFAYKPNQKRPIGENIKQSLKDLPRDGLIGKPSRQHTNFYPAVAEAKAKIKRGELTKDSTDFAKRIRKNNLDNFDKYVTGESVVLNAAEELIRENKDNPGNIAKIENQLREYGVPEFKIKQFKNYGLMTEEEAQELKIAKRKQHKK